MPEVKVEVPGKVEREVESWGVELEPLFLSFLKREFDKIEEFKRAIEEPEDELTIKGLADKLDPELLEVLSSRARAESQLTEEEVRELSEELKERVAKRHGL